VRGRAVNVLAFENEHGLWRCEYCYRNAAERSTAPSRACAQGLCAGKQKDEHGTTRTICDDCNKWCTYFWWKDGLEGRTPREMKGTIVSRDRHACGFRDDIDPCDVDSGKRRAKPRQASRTLSMGGTARPESAEEDRMGGECGSAECSPLPASVVAPSRLPPPPASVVPGASAMSTVSAAERGEEREHGAHWVCMCVSLTHYAFLRSRHSRAH
jgi:hypothetical protein